MVLLCFLLSLSRFVWCLGLVGDSSSGRVWWGLAGGVCMDVVLVEELCCAGVHRRRFFLAWVMRGCALFAKLTVYLKRAILIIV